MPYGSSVYSNLHVHGADVRSVAAAVRAEGVQPAYVSTAAGTWVSAYPELTERDDRRSLIDVGGKISARLSCAVLAFLVREEESFRYYLVERGALTDEYESVPQDAQNRRAETRGESGNPLLPYCLPGTTPAHLDELLRDRRVRGHSLMEESLGRLRAEIDSQRRHLTETHPDLVSRLRALGSPTPALENMLRRFDRLAKQVAEGIVCADVLAERVGRLVGLEPERCLVGYYHIRRGEAPAEMTLHIG